MTEKIPQWMLTFRSQDLLEETNEKQTPRMLLDLVSRGYVWSLCFKYSVLPDGGVMGQACTLLERVIAHEYKSYRGPRRNFEWRIMQQDLVLRMPLLASVCIALVTKMVTANVPFNSKAIQKELAKSDCPYSLSQINDAEQEVYQKLGFNVPLYTNTAKAAYMATKVGMPRVCVEAAVMITEVVDYYRNDIQRRVFELDVPIREDEPNTSTVKPNIRDIHLSAGCVVAACLFMRFSGDDPLPTLSFLSRCSNAYLKIVGDVIHHMIVDELGRGTESVETATQQPINIHLLNMRSACKRAANEQQAMPQEPIRQMPDRMCKKRRL